MGPSRLITPAPATAPRIVPLVAAGLLLSNCLATGQVPAESAKPTTGTFVLEWKNPSPDMEVSYGHGGFYGRPGMVVWQSVERPGVGSGPVQFQLPLPPGRGTLWYGFRDRGRPETATIFMNTYACPVGGQLRIEAASSGRSEPSGSTDPYQVSVDDTLWQEGCTFPDDPLALTAPAVATVSVRWLDPTPGVNLVVFADRRYDILITTYQGEVASQRRLMQSGVGTLWFDVSDPSKEVWSVHSQAFRCADGGHLEVAIDATIVGDRLSLQARYGGRGCQLTGPLQQKCGSDRRRTGRTKNSVA